jgi:hypothetical protein
MEDKKMTPPSNSDRVTNKDLIQAIHELKTEISVMKVKVDTEITKSEKLITDHEARIRALEKLVWTSSWVSSLVSTGFTAVIVLFITGKI